MNQLRPKSIKELLGENYQTHGDREIVRPILFAVQTALEPFRFGNVTLELVQHITEPNRILIWTDLLGPEYTFEGEYTPRDSMLDFEELNIRIAEQAFEYFHKTIYIVPPDNIGLGEN